MGSKKKLKPKKPSDKLKKAINEFKKDDVIKYKDFKSLKLDLMGR